MTEEIIWKQMDQAPKNGETIVGNYGTIEKPETALIRWSQKPICMLGSRNGTFPPGWATAIEADTDTNLPMDAPNYWTEYLATEKQPTTQNQGV